MRHLLPKSLILILSFAAAVPAFAVYKCEVDGKTTYGDLPCPGGSRVDAADRTDVAATDAAEAKARAAREKAQLAQIDQARTREDAARDKRVHLAARSAQVRKSRCDTLAQRAKWAEQDAAAASGRSAARARTRAHRAAEQFETQCKR